MPRRDPVTGRFVEGVPDIRARTRSEIHELAVGVLRNAIFVAWQPEELATCFSLLLMLMGPEDVPPNAHTMVGRVEHRINLAVNGLPMFHTGQWLTFEDTKALLAEYHRLNDMVNATCSAETKPSSTS